jgi:hypothetical protein
MKMSDNTIVLYGAPPDRTFPEPPRIPHVPPVPTLVPVPALAPCPVCSRHIYVGTTCPFCFAEQVAKAPSRAALESVKKSLEEALKVVDAALANSK